MPGAPNSSPAPIDNLGVIAENVDLAGQGPDRAWEAANVLDNLVTLCPSCHRRAEASVRIRSGLGGVAALLAGVALVYGLSFCFRDRKPAAGAA